ncbi:hypothetical protein YC2023_025204 [Brassica napus]
MISQETSKEEAKSVDSSATGRMVRSKRRTWDVSLLLQYTVPDFEEDLEKR